LFLVPPDFNIFSTPVITRRRKRMQLELDILDISDAQFASKTEVRDGVLFINREELQNLIEEDKRFTKVDLELAHPGENCRIAHVFDVIEPRAKIGGIGENFPGALGKLKPAGEGRTRVLRGAGIVITDYAQELHGTNPNLMVIDMSGPGVDLGLFGKLQNIVIICHIAEGVSRLEYQMAVSNAGLRTAVYLAEASVNLKGDETEIYDLGPLAMVDNKMEHLPRVGYIYQIHSLQQPIPKDLNWPIFYGDDTRKLLPTIVHPNEILDGAVIGGYTGHGVETYIILNHPIIKDLYKRHGKDLCFVGVVITIAQVTEPERERLAMMSAKLVKSVLGADAAILTKIGGGAPHVDLAQTCEMCEELGVKTALIAVDHSVVGECKYALLFNTPQANAIVNSGSMDALIKLPPVEKVIAGPASFMFSGKSESAEDEINIISWGLCGGVSHVGASKRMMQVIQDGNNKPEEKEDSKQCILQHQLSDRIGAERVVEMLLAKINGKPFETELPLPEFESIKPAPAVKDLSSAHVALVTDGGLVPKGNPDKIQAVNASRFGAYIIKGIERLEPADYEVVHIGYDNAEVSQDPHRLIPLDIARELENAGKIGKLCETMYCTTGVGGTRQNAENIAKGIAEKLKADGVDAVILTST
jgi:glycine reductase complex component B subunit alpha and beta